MDFDRLGPPRCSGDPQRSCASDALPRAMTLVQLAMGDLEHVRYLSSNDRSLLLLATKQLALAAVKAADAGHLPATLLQGAGEAWTRR